MKISKKRSNPTGLLRNMIRELRMNRNSYIYGEYVRPAAKATGAYPQATFR